MAETIILASGLQARWTIDGNTNLRHNKVAETFANR